MKPSLFLAEVDNISTQQPVVAEEPQLPQSPLITAGPGSVCFFFFGGDVQWGSAGYAVYTAQPPLSPL